MDYSKKDDRFLPIPENDECSDIVVQKIHPRRHILKRKVDGEKRTINVFETNFGTTYAVNAVTNIPYNVKFGSKHEDSLFSVILATGETGQNPITLFYDNPEQYERHFFTKLSNKTKHTWNNKAVKHRIQYSW